MEWQELRVCVRELHMRELHKLTQKLHQGPGDLASFEAGLEAWRVLSQELTWSVFGGCQMTAVLSGNCT